MVMISVQNLLANCPLTAACINLVDHLNRTNCSSLFASFILITIYLNNSNHQNGIEFDSSVQPPSPGSYWDLNFKQKTTLYYGITNKLSNILTFLIFQGSFTGFYADSRRGRRSCHLCKNSQSEMEFRTGRQA